MDGSERVPPALRLCQPDRVPLLEVAVAPQVAELLLGKASPEPHEVAQALGLDGLGVFISAPGYAESATSSQGHTFRGAGRVHIRADLAMTNLPDPDDERLYAPLRNLVGRYRGSTPSGWEEGLAGSKPSPTWGWKASPTPWPMIRHYP